MKPVWRTAAHAPPDHPAAQGRVELQHLLEGGDRAIDLKWAAAICGYGVRRYLHLQADRRHFPDYDAVIPIAPTRKATLEREVFKAALQRAAICPTKSTAA